MALRQEDRLPITDIMAQTPAIPDNCQWGLFLRNHDELTLEMVTDDERDYMNLAYASDNRMRINVGIRRRLAPLMDNNRRRIELLNSLLLSFPGTPIMYYGDEIGMGDNIYLGDRNGVRTPMQWNSDRNAGFSKAVPAKLYFPVIMDPIWGYQAINVEAQQSDASSLLHWTRNMIALRKIFQVFGRGTQEFLHPENRKVLAYIREYTDPSMSSDDSLAPHSETVLCVANLSRFAQPVQLDLSKYAGRQPVEMLGYVPFPIIDESPYAITLAPYSFFWLELQPAPARPSTPPVNLLHEAAASSEPTLVSLLKESGAELLDTLLPAYIARQRWFGGKSRTIRSTRITSTFPIDPTSLIALVEVTYTDTTTDLYQLPLAIVSEAEAATIQTTTPNAILTTLDNAVLIDATASPTFRTALLQHLIHANTPSSDLAATRSSALDPARLTDVPSRLGSAEQSNTSILYDDLAILKLFRRLRSGPATEGSAENPDVEIARFLTDVAHFPHIPAYLGDLHLTSDSTTLAFLQTFSPNLGDGWAWTLSDLDRFFTEVSTLPALTPDAITQHASGYLAAATLLGQRTAELHLALATPTGALSPDIAAAFAPEPTTPEDLANDRQRIHQQVTTALDALQSALRTSAAQPSTTLTPEATALATDLLAHRDDLLARVASLNGDAARFGQRIRIHGDYHLGQLLCIQTRTHQPHPDFLLIDFEGEPARSLAERRKKQSPLRDVAGMLRSFSYAAHTALQSAIDRTPNNAANLSAWASAWESATTAAFLRGYNTTIAANPALLPSDPTQYQVTLDAALLEKACYELLYELNNRPTWLVIPLSGILAIVRSGA